MASNQIDSRNNGYTADVESAPVTNKPSHPATTATNSPRSRSQQRQEDWTWENWGYRVEREWKTVARNIQILLGGAVGALLGITFAAIPTMFISASQYSLLVAQPVGAVLGAIVGGIIMLIISNAGHSGDHTPPIR